MSRFITNANSSLNAISMVSGKNDVVSYETTPKERASIAKFTKALARKEINKYGPEFRNCIKVVPDLDEEEKEFIEGTTHGCRITDWNLWKFNPNARTDYDKNEEFLDVLVSIEMKIINGVKNKTKGRFWADECGDWDDGGVWLFLGSYRY